MHSTRVCSGTGGGTRRCELAIPTTTRLRRSRVVHGFWNLRGGERAGRLVPWHGKMGCGYFCMENRLTRYMYTPGARYTVRAPTGPGAHTTEESASATHSTHPSGAAPAIVQPRRRLSCPLACHYQATSGGRGTQVGATSQRPSEFSGVHDVLARAHRAGGGLGAAYGCTTNQLDRARCCSPKPLAKGPRQRAKLAAKLLVGVVVFFS